MLESGAKTTNCSMNSMGQAAFMEVIGWSTFKVKTLQQVFFSPKTLYTIWQHCMDVLSICLKLEITDRCGPDDTVCNEKSIKLMCTFAMTPSVKVSY